MAVDVTEIFERLDKLGLALDAIDKKFDNYKGQHESCITKHERWLNNIDKSIGDHDARVRADIETRLSAFKTDLVTIVDNRNLVVINDVHNRAKATDEMLESIKESLEGAHATIEKNHNRLTDHSEIRGLWQNILDLWEFVRPLRPEIKNGDGSDYKAAQTDFSPNTETAADINELKVPDDVAYAVPPKIVIDTSKWRGVSASAEVLNRDEETEQTLELARPIESPLGNARSRCIWQLAEELHNYDLNGDWVPHDDKHQHQVVMYKRQIYRCLMLALRPDNMNLLLDKEKHEPKPYVIKADDWRAFGGFQKQVEEQARTIAHLEKQLEYKNAHIRNLSKQCDEYAAKYEARGQ